MDVSKYFNTTVVYEKFLGSNNDYKEAQFEKPLNIKARLEGNTRYIRNADNSFTVSEQSYWTTHDIKVRDRLNNQTVISVKPIYGFSGEIVYYEAYV